MPLLPSPRGCFDSSAVWHTELAFIFLAKKPALYLKRDVGVGGGNGEEKVLVTQRF